MRGSDSFFGLRAYCEELVEEQLEIAISGSLAVEPMLSAARHAVFPKGKRIRPLLSLFLCSDAGGNVERLLPAAISLELLHCASLVHDDLPALDNDDFRRGIPSCHKAYGEATAILTGDFLIALAQKMVLSSQLPEKVVLEQGFLIARSFMRICNGQQLDLLQGEDRAQLADIHSEKTGALFETACRVALLAAGADTRAVDVAGRFGLSLGVLFQIIDDYIDIFGSTQERGKPQSSDSRNNKETFFNCRSREDGFTAYEKARGESLSRLDELVSLIKPGARFAGTRFVVEQVCARMGAGGDIPSLG